MFKISLVWQNDLNLDQICREVGPGEISQVTPAAGSIFGPLSLTFSNEYLCCREKLSRRDYLDYLKYRAKSGDMAVLELTFRNVSLGKCSKNWSCYRRKDSCSLQFFSQIPVCDAILWGIPWLWEIFSPCRGIILVNNPTNSSRKLSYLTSIATWFARRLVWERSQVKTLNNNVLKIPVCVYPCSVNTIPWSRTL